MKKVLSLVLVIAMVLSSMSFAFAGTFTDVTGDYEDAVNALSALGVISGYGDDTFRPGNTLTRAELAVLLVQSLGYKDLVTGSKSNFSDTQTHWSNGYVAIASGTGLVQGYPDGTFKPDKGVSYDEAITMVLRAVGYVDSALKGTWPTNFKVKAIDLDLLDDVKMATAAADRGGVAQILFNALELPMVELGEDNVLVKVSPEKLFIDNIATPKTIVVNENHLDADHKDYAGDVVELAPYMYQSLDVYMNGSKDVVYIKGSNSLVFEGKLDEASDVTSSSALIVVEDADDVVYKFSTSGTAFMVNGVETNQGNVQFDKENVKVTVVIAGATDSDRVLKTGQTAYGVVAEKVTQEVQITTEYKAGRTKISGIALPLDDDNEVVLDKVTVTGDAETLEDISEDAIVTVYAGLDEANALKQTKLVVSNNVIEGKISKISADGKTVTIAGTDYKASGYATPLTSSVVGKEGTLFLNAVGKFRVFEQDEDDAVKKYAFVVGAEDGTYSTLLAAVDKYAKVKLATENDEEVVYSVAKDAKILSTTGVELTKISASGTAIEMDSKVTMDGTKVYKYALDSDGRVKSLQEVALTANTGFATDSKAFILAGNAVIFDAETTIGEYPVLTSKQLDDNITGQAVYNDDGEIELLVVRVGANPVSTDTYAIINNIEVTENTDEETVLLVTAYVNGEKVTYLTDDNFAAFLPGKTLVTDIRTALRNGYQFNQLSMDGNVITDIAPVATGTAVCVEGNVKTVKVDNDVITVVNAGGTEVIVLADDAVVYLQTDTAVVEVTDISDIDADSDATATSTEGDSIIALDTDNDGEFDLVVIKNR